MSRDDKVKVYSNVQMPMAKGRRKVILQLLIIQ
jgi:hypothetical protein